MSRLMQILVASVLAVTAAGCARGLNDAGSAPRVPTPTDFDKRAERVIGAWEAAAIQSAWKTGFVPLEALTRTGGDGTQSIYKVGGDAFAGNAKMAVIGGWFRLAAANLPVAPDSGEVRFADGSTIRVPLASARDAYAAMEAGDPTPDCHGNGCTLTVIGAELGTSALATSRGKATVPVWQFTVEELTVPMIRVAVAPSVITPLPTPAIGRDDYLTTVNAVSAAGDSDPPAVRRLTLHITGGACDSSRTGLIHETPVAVVVGVSIVQEPGACIALGVIAEVRAELAAPLGYRVLLDAATGQPLVLGACGPHGPPEPC